MELGTIALILQLLSAAAVGIYFYVQLSDRREARSVRYDSRNGRELQKLNIARAKKLTVPLSEMTRPGALSDIIGQEQGIRALRAALCSRNPQHVIIYGPPGIGKTCAARLVLEEAKKLHDTPFEADAPFIEVDATCVRFDERSIADQLMGSVHDPIYQGAGALGQNGIPQPKPGAVTKANGGVLFLDEIGELHPVQMNKLLKVLEDRRVMLDSAYYNPDDEHTPSYIHDIFKNGLPADFRLIGATTRRPEEMPPAIRSRCLELYFRALRPCELASIARSAAAKSGFSADAETAECVSKYSASGRDAVNIVQLAGSAARNEGRLCITPEDIEWVAQTCRYSARIEKQMPDVSRKGVACGMAVLPDGTGMIIEVEAITVPGGSGVSVTGIVDEEEIESAGRKLRRRSTASASVENVLTALRMLGIVPQGSLHVNFPGGIPVDGPSAGAAIAIALTSAITGKLPSALLAATGEVSITGQLKPVGGVRAKTEAALAAGASSVIIPAENAGEACASQKLAVVYASTLSEALDAAFLPQSAQKSGKELLSAAVR